MARTPYPTDLTDAQWEHLEPLIPDAEPGGRPREVDMREVVNGILYINRGGCAWRMLPHEFPPRGTVHYDYRRFRLDGTWEKVPRPAAGTGATQSRQEAHAFGWRDRQPVGEDRRKRGGRGYDAGKKIKGRKRHRCVDTLGLILAVVVHSASVQDRDGGEEVLVELAGRFTRLKKL